MIQFSDAIQYEEPFPFIHFDDCENFGELNIHSVKKTTTPEFDNSGYIKSKVSIFKKIIPKLMAEVASLSVPLIADMGEGDNWEQAH